MNAKELVAFFTAYLILVAIAALALVIVFMTITPARAHDWYPPSCCGGYDCDHLPRNAVKWTPQGWLVLETGEVIPEEEAQQSPDHEFHRCRQKADQPQSKTRMSGSKRCFWAPGGGV